MESYRCRALEEAFEVEHLEKFLVERGDAAGGYRSRALEEAIEVEHLEKVLVERELERGGRS